MTKKITTLTFSLLAFVATFVSILSLNPMRAQAASSLQPGVTVVVDANALNLREAPCGKVKQVLKKNDLLSTTYKNSKVSYCNINGVRYAFQQVVPPNFSSEVDLGYVAIRYVTKVANTVLREDYDYKVNTAGAKLNMRKTPCGTVIGTLSNGTMVQSVNSPDQKSVIQVCTIGGAKHAFIKVTTNGKVGYVSGMYLM